MYERIVVTMMPTASSPIQVSLKAKIYNIDTGPAATVVVFFLAFINSVAFLAFFMKKIFIKLSV